MTSALAALERVSSGREGFSGNGGRPAEIIDITDRVSRSVRRAFDYPEIMKEIGDVDELLKALWAELGAGAAARTVGEVDFSIEGHAAGGVPSAPSGIVRIGHPLGDIRLRMNRFGGGFVAGDFNGTGFSALDPRLVFGALSFVADRLDSALDSLARDRAFPEG